MNNEKEFIDDLLKPRVIVALSYPYMHPVKVGDIYTKEYTTNPNTNEKLYYYENKLNRINTGNVYLHPHDFSTKEIEECDKVFEKLYWYEKRDLTGLKYVKCITDMTWINRGSVIEICTTTKSGFVTVTEHSDEYLDFHDFEPATEEEFNIQTNK